MPQPTPLVRLCRVVVLVVLLLWGTPAGAGVIKLTSDDFVGASVIDFTDVPSVPRSTTSPSTACGSARNVRALGQGCSWRIISEQPAT